MTKKDDINFDYNEEVKKCKTIDDVIGKDGLVQRLIKYTIGYISSNILFCHSVAVAMTLSVIFEISDGDSCYTI